MRFSKTQNLVTIGFLIVLQVVMGRFLGFKTLTTTINFGFLPLVVTGILFGPVPAMASAAVSDVLGAFLFPVGAYFPGFTLSAALTGLTYGLFLYNKPQKLWRTAICVLITEAFISLVISTYWVYIISGKAFIALLPVRATQAAIMIALKMLLIPLICYAVIPLVQKKAVPSAEKKEETLFEEAKAFLMKADVFGSVMGLRSIRELLRRLENPQMELKIVHIAGTNGKGSVMAFLASILKVAGYRVGRYSSPPLRSQPDGIQVNGEEMEKAAFAKGIAQIQAAVQGMLAERLAHPTRFEIETALAFLYFKEKACDIVLLETGLGGLQDATNVVDNPILEIITRIGMDHMSILGDRLELIAAQKAGIIKDHSQVVSIRQDASVETVLNGTCQTRQARMVYADPARQRILEKGVHTQRFSYQSAGGTMYEEITIRLSGSYQFENAIIALEAAEALHAQGFVITKEQLLEGMESARWEGRFTVVRHDPLVILDGAHNEDAARELAKSIEGYFPGQRIIFLLGIMKDKEYEKMIKLTVHLADKIIAVNAPEIERLLPAGRLAETVKEMHPNVQSSQSIEHAVRMALEDAGPEDVIIAFGSLSWLSAAKEAIFRHGGNFPEA